MQRGFWEKLEKPIIGLAPMDGVTDAAFRYMVAKCSGKASDAGSTARSGVKGRCAESGAGYPSLSITEFTNVEGLARGAVKMLKAFIYNEIERPVVGQIYGVEPESYYKCAVMLCEMGFDGIDINMGCPANKVARHGSGAGLIKTPELAKKLIRVTKQAVLDWSRGLTLEEAGVHEDVIAEIGRMKARRAAGDAAIAAGATGGGGGAAMTAGSSGAAVAAVSAETTIATAERRILPVSVKTRIGYDLVVAEEWVQHLLEEEPANITMHGRTLKQMYMGRADWEVLARAARIVRSAGVSFLGNGDVTSMDDALEKIERYGIDGVLVGRATLGNPWFFNGDRAVETDERMRAALEHARYFEQLRHLPFHNLKKHLAWYCKDFDGAREMRMKLMQSESGAEVAALLATGGNSHCSSYKQAI